MRSLPELNAIPLFDEVQRELITLLKSLSAEEWRYETSSSTWNVKDIAREYTEKWYHQQQIREAAGSPLLVQKKWLLPLIDTLIRGVLITSTPVLCQPLLGSINLLRR